MLYPQNIVLNDINELSVKVVLTLLTISKFANLGQEIQRVWRHCNFNDFSFFSGILTNYFKLKNLNYWAIPKYMARFHFQVHINIATSRQSRIEIIF